MSECKLLFLSFFFFFFFFFFWQSAKIKNLWQFEFFLIWGWEFQKRYSYSFDLIRTELYDK